MAVAPIFFAELHAHDAADDPPREATIHVLDITGSVSTYRDAELCTAERELVIETRDARTVYAAGRWVAYSEQL